MKKYTFILVGLLVMTAFNLFAGDSLWFENIEQARVKAKETGKPMLLDFSGSDWCVWCKRLDKEVFSKSVFQAYAKDNLVLVNLDFPQFTSQSDDLKKQNQQLAQTYKIRGFPTVILLSSDGKEIGRTGYQPGGPEKYVEHLKSIIQTQSAEKTE
jgi:protein disulfide-isomerase